MTIWIALFKKDFRLTRTVFFVGLFINFLLLLLTLYIGNHTGDNLYLFIPLVAAVALHILYVPIMVFISLRAEAIEHNFWLHSPQSSTMLLLSKILSGIVMALVSLAVLYMMAGWLIISRFSLIEEYWSDTWLAGLLAFPHIIAASTSIAVWVIFLWTLYYALRYRIGRWTSLVLLVAVVIPIWISTINEFSSMYEQLTSSIAFWVAFLWLLYYALRNRIRRWISFVLLGAIIIPIWVSAVIESSSMYEQLTHWISLEMNFPAIMQQPIPVYAGEYVYNMMIVVGVFLWSTWIMDRKVEV